MERLDKILSHSGFGTRKEVKSLLRSRLVSINGEIVVDGAFHVDFQKDEIVMDGEKIGVEKHIYLMMNKCKNVVCSAKEGEHETVFSLVDSELLKPTLGGTLHTIGRLDIDTEGLLILTTDGSLTHDLISPKHHISKTYAVTLRDKITDEAEQQKYIEKMKNGIEIPSEGHEKEFFSKPAELVWGSSPLDSTADCLLTVYEGKYHQVKRMFQAMKNEVIGLKRVAIGKLFLDATLKVGEYRKLTREELLLLRP